MILKRISGRRAEALVTLAACVWFGAAAPTFAATEAVSITEQDGKLRIEIGGALFSEYHYRDVSRPFLYPILGPAGKAMTRNWPMKEAPGEDRDHPHHRSLWHAHGALNGQDFWSEGGKAGKTVHDQFVEIKSGDAFGLIRSKNKYIAKDGTLVATDERTIRIAGPRETPTLDFDITLQASQGDLVLGDTKEGTMAIRIAESMRLVRDKKPGAGHIVNSEGVRDGETWGKRAKWCDYYGPVDGEVLGIAMFDHPKNPRHPTWWHVRDYGLFAANPFGVHDFEKKPAGAGDLKIEAGQGLTFRYRFYFHRGDEQQGHVAERYEAYVNSNP